MEDFCRLVSRLDERHVAEYTLKKEFQDQREEIQAQFENFETLSTQALLAPPRRTTRRQAENAELPKMTIKESLVHEVKSITDKLWMGQLADIDDGDVLQSRIDSIANGSLASLKECIRPSVCPSDGLSGRRAVTPSLNSKGRKEGWKVGSDRISNGMRRKSFHH